jgi:2-polyprenyl-3-methyl-5-hydroxy-6-metoxy-1,4-benzoquinol methylase
MVEIDNALRVESCPLCGAHRIRRIGKLKSETTQAYASHDIRLQRQPELWSCLDCDSMFTQYAVPEKAAASLYCSGSGESWTSNVPFEQDKTDAVVESLGHLMTKGVSVLDIGANQGELLDFAAHRGCKTFAVEPSQPARIILEQKGHRSFSSSGLVNEMFDVICAFDLIEHLYDVRSFLRFCNEHLVDNGKLVLLTGNIACPSAVALRNRWWYVQFPEHVRFPSMKYLGTVPGFRIAHLAKTYHSRNFQVNLFRFFRGFAIKMLHGTYGGLPSISADHILVILEKHGLAL